MAMVFGMLEIIHCFSAERADALVPCPGGRR